MSGSAGAWFDPGANRGAHLAASGEQDALSRGHFEYFCSLARDARLAVDSEPLPQDIDFAEREGANLKVAIDRAAARDEVAAALSLLVELEQHWATREPFEGVRRVRELLARDGAPTRLHARALRVLGGLLQMLGDVDGAAEHPRGRWSSFAPSRITRTSRCCSSGSGRSPRSANAWTRRAGS